MTDKQLADAVRLAGWLRDDGVINAPWGSWTPGLHKHTWQDWQLWVLAGALMEKLDEGIEYGKALNDKWDVGTWLDDGPVFTDESLPRAIIEACVEALGKVD
jgi:hypothetical protein